MAPKYTLHYFQVPARGEFIRIIFNHAGVEFQDLTFSAKDISKIKDDGKNAKSLNCINYSSLDLFFEKSYRKYYL